jgi:hypothetical protein
LKLAYNIIFLAGFHYKFHHVSQFLETAWRNDASFIAKTDTLLKTGFDVKMNGVSVFQDFFLRLSESKLESVVCADSMFYMHKQKRSNDEKDWKQFSRKWQLFRMQFSTLIITFSVC